MASYNVTASFVWTAIRRATMLKTLSTLEHSVALVCKQQVTLTVPSQGKLRILKTLLVMAPHGHSGILSLTENVLRYDAKSGQKIGMSDGVHVHARSIFIVSPIDELSKKANTSLSRSEAPI